MRLRSEIIIVTLILVTAAIFRLPNLSSAPPGLYPDEAMNGNNAIEAWETGQYKLYYPENNGREGLFIAIQSLSVAALGNTAAALRVVSAFVGILTVLGLYLLTRELFNRHIASIAAFITAVSFWHVNFSRIGFRAIMAPMFAVWGFYFLWKGLRDDNRGHYVLSGIAWGLGIYTYIAFRVMPLAILATLAAYWSTLREHFSGRQYNHVRLRMIQGVAALALAGIVVALPLLGYYFIHPEDFFGRTSDISIFSQDNPIRILLNNTAQTLGMFTFVGDHNWRHNFSGQPELAWPLTPFFAVGILGGIWKLWRSRREHGHVSPVHAMLLSWFAFGLLPVVFSSEGIPHALRAILVVPPVMIYTALGLWWLVTWGREWYYARDIHRVTLPDRTIIREGTAVVTAVVTIFLVAVGIFEYDRYFNKWATHPAAIGEFNQNYVNVAAQANALPDTTLKYILVNRDTGVSVNGIPVAAQTVMYLTDTYTPAKQKSKNLYYLLPEQYRAGQYDHRGVILPLEAPKP